MNALFASELFAGRAAGELLTEIPIAVTGNWVKDGHRFSITREDLDDVVRNFRKRGNGQVVVDFEHASERPEVAKGGPVPAAGWINSLDVREKPDASGAELWGDVDFNDDAKELIKSKKYRYFSPAIDWGAVDKKTGRGKGATITSAALTNHPFLEELPAIELSEKSGKVLDKMVVPVVDNAKTKVKIDAKHGDDEEEMSDLSLDQRRAAVTQAIQKSYGGSPLAPLGTYPWLKELFDDYAIVENDGKLYRCDYTIDDQGNVELEKPKQVQIQYEEVPMQFDDNPQHEKYEVRRKPSGDEEDQFVVDGGRPDRGGRPEAERRGAKIDEPSSDDETEELRDSTRLPRLGLRKMSSSPHHAVVNPKDGRIHGFVSHGDLMAYAERHKETSSKPAATEVMHRTKKLMAQPGNETMSYRQAHSAVLMSDTVLAERYRKEQTRLIL